jgi:oleate hydratase
MKIAIERSPNTTEAWIIGSGISALASAVYLIEIAKVPPQRVHIWDHNVSLGNVIQPEGDPVRGYDQFGGCLPVPVGAPLRELLALVPSAHKPATSQSVLDDIVSREIGRNRPQKNEKVNFLIQKKGKLESLSSHSSIQLKDRQRLARFLLTCERRMKRKRICDFFPESFFQSFFWVILSIQYGDSVPLSRKYILMFALLT